MRDHALGLADRRQVVGPIPLGQKFDVRSEFLPRARRDVESQHCEARGELGGKAGRHHGDHANNALRSGRLWPMRFRWTSKSEIEAGVTPEIRAAWPIVSGLC